MLINLSNHPYNQWSQKQKEAAVSDYGSVEDIRFPHIDPAWDTEKVFEFSQKYAKLCIDKLKNKRSQTNAVHIMGEMTFSYQLINILKQHKFTCIASTTDRIVKNNASGKKEVHFNFVRFRKY